ncbi:transcriptional regulator [Eubacterium limosum]|uniref:transcriptional regulator n=1 Tax=Eubacterium limosum TaxID=1736 RepID=UPI00371CDBC2
MELAELKQKVLEAMRENGAPMNAGAVQKALDIDRKEIDKAFKELKAEGAIVSPVRCKWEPANK